METSPHFWDVTSFCCRGLSQTHLVFCESGKYTADQVQVLADVLLRTLARIPPSLRKTLSIGESSGTRARMRCILEGLKFGE